MNKEHVEMLASEMLSRYSQSEEERWLGFTAVMQEYGCGRQDELIKEEAERMLAQINEHKAPAKVNGVEFAFKRAWIEDQDGCGRIIAEYVRNEERKEIDDASSSR